MNIYRTLLSFIVKYWVIIHFGIIIDTKTNKLINKSYLSNCFMIFIKITIGITIILFEMQSFIITTKYHENSFMNYYIKEVFKKMLKTADVLI